MQTGAPRHPARPWAAVARGARLALCLWLTSPVAAVAQEAVAARYEGAVTRYPHGVLGDEVEYDTLAVTLSDGRVLRRRWDAPLVFEDVAPRLWDVTGDGRPEIVTVESHETRGARLAIWTVAEGSLDPLAATPFIGQRFRWLAPVGAADLDGDGAIEIAYVDRPHLAKTLRIWRYTDGAMHEVAAAPGFTNHRIGWDYIAGGLRDCGDGPEMILASGDWSRTVALRFDGRLRARDLGGYSADRMAAALTCR
ncbi:FG-GAP repeat domain-containing protein [Antarctobacter sp.]|uniref:FG-GAP repeat domain-containing protein n=1 Tax=Antarctobacter sp. TaxID=1872577 RepID=UPI003A8CF8FE